MSADEYERQVEVEGAALGLWPLRRCACVEAALALRGEWEPYWACPVCLGTGFRPRGLDEYETDCSLTPAHEHPVLSGYILHGIIRPDG